MLKLTAKGRSWLRFEDTPDGKTTIVAGRICRSWGDKRLPASARIIKAGPSKDWDLFEVHSNDVVSGRLKQLLDRQTNANIEYHQFAIFDRKGNLRPGEYFIFDLLDHVNAVDFERSQGRRPKKSDGTDMFTTFQNDIFLHAGAIDGLEVWRDDALGHKIFVSDRVAEEIRKSGLNILRNTPVHLT